MFRFLILAALLLPAATAQSDALLDTHLRFALFNAGRPMQVDVIGVSPTSIGDLELDKAKMQAAVADRLRSVGLWTASKAESGDAWLHVTLLFPSPDTLFVKCSLFKMFMDEFGNFWRTDVPIALNNPDYIFTDTVSHNGDAGYVEFVTLRLVDKFVAAYKRVNGL